MLWKGSGFDGTSARRARWGRFLSIQEKPIRND
jgi:hypothetical protein